MYELLLCVNVAAFGAEHKVQLALRQNTLHTLLRETLKHLMQADVYNKWQVLRRSHEKEFMGILVARGMLR